MFSENILAGIVTWNKKTHAISSPEMFVKRIFTKKDKKKLVGILH